MRSFYGKEKRRSYFEGWYLKHQSETQTVSLIPASHVDRAGRASASLQVITDSQTHSMHFPAHQFYADQSRFLVRLEDSVFSQRGCKLNIRTRDCTLQGTLRYGPFTPPAYDIMGPFAIVPFMECRHSVFSLYHRVNGEISINGEVFRFNNGSGYMEGDRGMSFPRRYLWTQCCWKRNSIMLSVADIPFCGCHFIGCIGFIYLNGQEHRLATYCGVRLLQIKSDSIVVRQGDITLKAELLESNSHPLRAPQSGGMTRTIHESASCRVRYTCLIGKKPILDFVSNRASFENCWD